MKTPEIKWLWRQFLILLYNNSSGEYCHFKLKSNFDFLLLKKGQHFLWPYLQQFHKTQILNIFFFLPLQLKNKRKVIPSGQFKLSHLFWIKKTKKNHLHFHHHHVCCMIVHLIFAISLKYQIGAEINYNRVKAFGNRKKISKMQEKYIGTIMLIISFHFFLLYLYMYIGIYCMWFVFLLICYERFVSRESVHIFTI